MAKIYSWTTECIVRGYLTKWDRHVMRAAEMFGLPPEQVSRSLRQEGKAYNYFILYGGQGLVIPSEAR